ncbi:ankyrin repeat domain-containing protein [Pseudoxanthomonas sp. UC19_8]|uniref:ankyrin repeat domain-containing protein n=1 Tax=Pseudoxanthomonas sp. UC19_8 TaxID=3350175 RepID=UPI0036D33592
MPKSKLRKPRNDFNALFAAALIAAITGDLKPLRACLLSGVNPDSPERGNFMRSLLFWHDLPDSVAKVLLDAKADASARDTAGFTPLHNANVGVARLLLLRGADIEAREAAYGGTPLLVHAAMGRADMVEFLLDRGANVDAKTDDGDTAYDVAIAAGYVAVCNVLKRHDAARRRGGLTAVAASSLAGNRRTPAASSEEQRRM